MGDGNLHKNIPVTILFWCAVLRFFAGALASRASGANSSSAALFYTSSLPRPGDVVADRHVIWERSRSAWKRTGVTSLGLL